MAQPAGSPYHRRMAPVGKSSRSPNSQRSAHAVPVARARAPYVVGFYLFDAFPMMAFAAAIEPLRAANRLAGQRLFDWRLISHDGKPVSASNGIPVATHASLAEASDLHMLLVCAGVPDAGARDTTLIRWLRSQARNGVAVGGISLGAYAVAYAGLLDGRRCALHWERLAAFSERFPRIRTTTDIFVIDGDRYTCSGGTAALDMMLQVITERHGRALATGVSEQFIHPRIRGAHDSQRIAIESRLGIANAKLIAAVGIMEKTADEPRPVQAIAAELGLSSRQLERLFATYLQTSPGRYYLKLRLERARAMLLETTRPILDVAVACGFASASHFSRCYRALFGQRPSEERAAAFCSSGSRHEVSRGSAEGRRAA